MIKSLSLVASIVSGMGAGIMSAPIQQLDGTSTTTTQTQQPYSINVQPEYKSLAYSWRQEGVGPLTQYGVIKYSNTTRTSQGEIKGTVYQNTNIIDQGATEEEEYRYTFDINIGAENPSTWNKNNTLSVLTINPYDEWTTSNLDLTFRTTIQYKLNPRYLNYIANNHPNFEVYIEYNTQYAITTDDRYAKYSDAFITNEQKNVNWWQDVITNANDLYRPTAEYQTAKIAQVTNGIPNYETNNVSIDKSIPINNNKNNYIFMYTTRKIRLLENAVDLEDDTIQMAEVLVDHEGGTIDGIKYWYPERDYSFTMTGNFIPGTHIEVIDLPSIMFQVLGMPFTFITTAFSLTLFPGTPYAIDIGNIFLGFLGIIWILLVVKLVIKLWGKV